MLESVPPLNAQLSVLIVDDEPEILEQLTLCYQSGGFKVLQANGGNTAFEMVTTYRPDLVLTDLRMVNGNGIDLIRRINQLTQPRPLVFCMTAYSDLEAAQAYEYGVALFLVKPFSLELLLNASKRFLNDRAEIMQSAMDLHALVNSIAHMIFVVKPTFEIVFCNANASEFIKTSFPHGFSNKFIDTLGDESRAEFEFIFRDDTLKHTDTIHGKMKLKTNHTRDVQYFATAGIWQGNAVWFIMVAEMLDVVIENEKLVSEIEQLKKAGATQITMWGALQHELGNRVFVIKGLSECIGKSITLEPMTQKYVNMLQENSKQLVFLLRDLSDLSIIESGKFSLVQETFSIKEFLLSLVADAEILNTNPGIKIESFCDESLSFPVFGPMRRIRQILLNIINNALKYTEKGAVFISARTFNEFDDNLVVEFEVRDTGVGIAEKDLNELFTPFYRGKQWTSKAKTGSGIGLYLCKRILENMRGNIKITSEVGHGTQVFIQVPLVYDN